MNSRARSAVFLAALTLWVARPAFAQSTSGPGVDSASDEGLKVIVVTAQKRSEPLQNVPVAVTALSADSLETKGIRSVTDLGMVTPGLVYPTSGIGGSPRIRGVGTQFAFGGNENSVATYVDGVYYPSSGANLMTFNNIDQVAVLKGPQGTLFGRNATGGLIQITTRDPQPGQSLEGNAQVGYGNHDTISGNAYVADSVSNGLAADLALNYQDRREGFGKNLYNGSDVGNTETLAARNKWKAELGDATSATLILDYSRLKGNIPAYRPAPGTLPVTGVPFTGGKFDVNSDTQPRTDNEDYGASLNLGHEFSGAKLVSISAYRRGVWKFQFDSESLPVPILSIANGVLSDRMFSQEIQLLSTSEGPVTWVTGLYYFNRKAGPTAELLAPVLGFNQDIATRQKTESYSGYGQATYAVAEDTAMTLGLRLTAETKSFYGNGVYHSLAPTFDAPLGPLTDKKDVTKPTWRAAIDHHLTKAVMVYASYNRGFKSGGYDPSNVNPTYVRPEVLDAFEIGMKSEFLDHRLRINGASYYYDFRDIHLNTYRNGLPSVYNGKSAKTFGLDLDVAAVPVTGLTLTAGLAYVHDRFGDFPITQTTALPTGGIIQLADISAEGKRLPNTPDWTVNLGVEYKVAIGSANLTLSGDYFHSGEWFSEPENRTRQDAYSLVNSSATLSFADDRYSVTAWGKNLGNVAYASQLFMQIPVADVVAVAEGRTFGVTLGVKF